MLRTAIIALAIAICAVASAQDGRIRANKENPHWVDFKTNTIFVLGYPRAVTRNAVGTGKFNVIEDIRLSTDRNNKIQTLTLFDPAGFYFPWLKDFSVGKFDLNKTNDSYWGRLRDYSATCANGMNLTMINLVLWDESGLTGDRPGAWPVSPWNPKNNVTYGEDQLPTNTGLPAFYRTIPALDNKPTALKCQQELIAKTVYGMTLYQNVIFSLGSPSAPKEWQDYWVDFIHKEAEKQKIDIIVSVDLGTTEKSQPEALDVSSQLRGKTIMEQHKIIADAYAGLGAAQGKPKIIWSSQVPAIAPAQLWTMFASGGGGVIFDQNTTTLEQKLVDTWIETFRGITADMKLATLRYDPSIVKEGTAFGLINPGVEAVIYVPFGGDITIDLSSFKGDCYAVLWDTNSGSTVNRFDLAAKPNVKVTMPVDRITGADEKGYPKFGAEVMLRVYGQG